MHKRLTRCNSTPSPTLARTNAALKGVIKYLIQQAAQKDRIDGTDVS